jgi:DNA polymerase-3 subunit gamma/tau
MAVLYNKYRPQNFSEVLNQKYIIQTLKNQVKSESVSHAYLFTGSRGVGKTSVARILAKAVNCLKLKDGDPCGKCGSCLAISSGSFLDLVEVDAASNTGVDNIRDLIDHVKFSPSLGKYKVFIIDEVHMLSKGAFNALLKTLEEPPKHAIFILATTEINKVPATIVSRTQRFDFKALSAEDLLSHLQHVIKEEKIKLSTEVLSLVAQNAQGSVRDSLSLLDKVATLGDNPSLADSQQLLGVTDIKVSEQLFSLIVLGEVKEIPTFFTGLSESGQDFLVFNRDFLEFLRKMLIWKITGETNSLFPKTAVENLEKISLAELILIIKLFLKSYKDIGFAPSPEVPLLIASIEGSLRKNTASANSNLALKGVSTVKTTPPPPAPKFSSFNTAQVEPSKEANLQEAQEDLDEASMEEVKEVWPKIVLKVKEVNSPLANVLKSVSVEGVSGGRIHLGVKFLFHKQNIENTKSQTVLLNTIEKVLGKKLAARAVVLKSDNESSSANPAEALSDALKLFGGEIIE